MLSLSKTWKYCLTLILLLTLTPISYGDRLEAKPTSVQSKPRAKANGFVYTPIKLPSNGEVKDVLSEKDIPTGDGGFARDYAIELVAGDQLAIDLTSEVFDTVVILLNAEGKNIGKNDDGPDGTSNSLLFVRIKDTGNYVIRIQGFGETSSGEFKLKVTKLKAQ
jgi:Bacterial pre-peptidase C-terminal domain